MLLLLLLLIQISDRSRGFLKLDFDDVLVMELYIYRTVKKRWSVKRLSIQLAKLKILQEQKDASTKISFNDFRDRKLWASFN
jgi:hypothetical protein